MASFSTMILVAGANIEEMKQGTSRIRNHVITRVFREINLIEQWGTGVRRIFKDAMSLNLPEPRIEEVDVFSNCDCSNLAFPANI